MTAKVGALLLETQVLWRDLVHGTGHAKEQAHQIDLSDEKWRELLDELGEADGEVAMEKERAENEKLISGPGFAELDTYNDLEERIVEIRDILKAVKDGDDARKLMRRMSRRQSTLRGTAMAIK